MTMVVGLVMLAGCGEDEVESTAPAALFTVWSVLWPERTGAAPAAVKAEWHSDALVVTRPDGKTDTLTLNHDTLTLR